jgi:hypothetical protein
MRYFFDYRAWIAAFCFLAWGLSGCSARSNENDAGHKDGAPKDGSSDGGDTTIASGLTICDIQNPASVRHPENNSAVTVKDVVVTSPMTKGASASTAPDAFWVAQPGGCGPDGKKWSGIYVFAKNLTISVKPGDKLDIAGIYTEYYDESEIQASSVTITGTEAIPEPAVVAPSAVCKQKDCSTTNPPGVKIPCADGAEAEAYEGVLVALENVEVANTAAPGSDCKPHGDFSVKAAGSDDEMFVSTLFRASYNYTPTAGQKFAKIAGILEYSFEQFKVQPRSCDDLIGEGGATVCSSCADPPPTVTIAQIQNPAAPGHVDKPCAVKVENVVVTTPVISGKHFYVSDPAGGEWSGVYVYNGAGLPTTGIAPGKLVTIEGTLDEYYELTELKPTSITVVGDGTVPAPTVVTPDEVCTGCARQENFEGCLVKLENVKITKDCVAGNDGKDHGDFAVAAAVNPNEELVVGAQFRPAFSCFDPQNACPHDANYQACATDQRAVDLVLSSIVGVMDFSYSQARLQPRSDADIVK